MDQTPRWTPDPTGAGAPDPRAWDAMPAPAPEPAPAPRRYVGDPRWGILADDAAPPTPGFGVPLSAAPAAASGYAAPAPSPSLAPAPASFAPPAAVQPAFGQPSFGQPAFAQPTYGAARPVGGFVPAPAFAPVRAKNPGWVIALAVLAVGTILAGVGAAVAIPVFLNARAKDVTADLRDDLMSVAAAEEVVRAQTGSYSADPDTVTAQLGSGLSSRVSIMWADASGWCGQAVPVSKTTPQLYFSTQSGVSEQSCG